jgi:hypothetical protein
VVPGGLEWLSHALPDRGNEMIRRLAFALVICLSACGGVTDPSTPPNDFSTGNFAMNIVASDSCTTLADAGRNRGWNVGLVLTGSAVVGTVQGWSDPATVITQITLAGTTTGRTLSLTGSVYETIVGCTPALCYRAEGTMAATQTGNVLTGTFNGVVAYDATSCTATDHKVTLTRR